MTSAASTTRRGSSTRPDSGEGALRAAGAVGKARCSISSGFGNGAIPHGQRCGPVICVDGAANGVGAGGFMVGCRNSMPTSLTELEPGRDGQTLMMMKEARGRAVTARLQITIGSGGREAPAKNANPQRIDGRPRAARDGDAA